MTKIDNIRIDLPEKPGDLLAKVRKKLRNNTLTEANYKIVKKSIDARDKSKVQYVYSVELLTQSRATPPPKQTASGNFTKRPVIIGTGPAGVFCALTLAEAGANPILIERGKDVDSRQKDVDAFFEKGILDANSNIQFGEGGAGSFSDGKLTSGIKNSRIKTMLETFVRFGAPEEILIMQKPHIGTDRLLPIMKNMREYITSLGGEYRFSHRLIDIIHSDGQLTGAQIEDEKGDAYILDTDHLVLAIGHSPRDTYEMLHRHQVSMDAKAFAVGLRIEHTQDFINQEQYGKFSSCLPSAEYKLATKTSQGRNVYTFCMCPGGVVVAASSEPEMVVTNGMSYYARDEENANSAIVVAVTPEDYGDLGNPLSGMAFQRQLERAAFEAGGRNYQAPAQLVGDFLANRPSQGLTTVTNSYKPGVTMANFHEILPSFMAEALQEGILHMDKKIKGFADPNALLTGIESRTSAPVRINRNEHYEANIRGLHPCGEGAGYAGGITSSAVDGIKCAEILLTSPLG